MKKVLITGGSGFIGRNLQEGLKEDFIILSPSHKELDILDLRALVGYLEENRIEIIIHAAVHVPMFNGVDKEFFNDMQMFMNLEKVSNRVEKIIYFGSGAEFDKRYDIHMVSEDDFGYSIPVTEYGLAKYTMTKIARASNNIYNLRLFGVFGKYELWQLKFISNLCCKAIYGLPLSIRKDCNFDYLFIDDLVQIVKWAINTNLHYHDYNACLGKPYSLVELARLVRDISGKKLEIHLLSDERNVDYTASNQRLCKEARGIRFTPMELAIKSLYKYYYHNKGIIDFEVLKESR